MSLDSPARIAVIGAGPIGLEAALYGRFLGYEMDIYERGSVAENLNRWGHMRLFTPFGLNRSSLGLAALRAQDSSWNPPADDALLTGREFIRSYLWPLAESDLLGDRIYQQTAVLAIGKEQQRKGQLVGQEERGDEDFRLLVRDRDGRERVVTADAVIDASGTFGTHNWLGCGGIPAIGELAAAPQIEYGQPDIGGADRERYSGRHTMVIGNNLAAARTISALFELTRAVPETRVTWITSSTACDDPDAGPVPRTTNDPYAIRDELIRSANELCKTRKSALTHWPATMVDAVEWLDTEKQFHVRLLGQHAGAIVVDRVIANVGFRPNHSITRELHLETDFASESTVGNARVADAPDAGGEHVDSAADRLATPEEHFYVLGQKSHGRNCEFLIADGLRQIRDLYTLIGDRPNLDLYKTIGGEGLKSV